MEIALQLIQNKLGLTEADLMANKAAYIADSIRTNKIIFWVTLTIMITLLIITIISNRLDWDSSTSLLGVTTFAWLLGIIIVIVTAGTVNSWQSQPDIEYAKHIINLAQTCLG